MRFAGYDESDPPMAESRFAITSQASREVALLGVLTVVALERPLDIDGMDVVAFNQVAVIAVHRPHEIGERGEEAFRERAAQPGAFGRQFQCEIGSSGRCFEPCSNSSGSIMETVSS